MTLRALLVAFLVLGLAGAPAVVTAADQNEPKVSLDQVPAPVKATIDKETAKGATLKDITRETEGTKTFYEATLVGKNGKERMIHIADNGKIIKRERMKKEAQKEGK
jgi:uncharacterized membrane protein YkoI